MPPAADFLPKPLEGDDPTDDPRDRAWRCRIPLGRLREEEVGCSNERSVSSEGFLGPADKQRTTFNTHVTHLVLQMLIQPWKSACSTKWINYCLMVLLHSGLLMLHPRQKQGIMMGW